MRKKKISKRERTQRAEWGDVWDVHFKKEKSDFVLFILKVRETWDETLKAEFIDECS